jgi:streptogramin lyase
VVPSMQELDGDQQTLDAERAQRASPGAFVARVRSRTEFEHVGSLRAAQVAREAFPALIEKHDGGVPAFPAGEKLRRFSAENVAQISLSDHERGVVESIEPMAIRAASGRFEPIDLALKDEGASFTPTASQVAVQIPKHLGGGVRAPGSGVSLTPADGKGQALGGSEGSVDGASVLYANTQTDADTLAKPTSVGFELSAILRSDASPHELYYRLGLPSGASLVQHQQHSPVQVVKEGVTVGMVLPPTAVDAAGTPVPVTMAVNGDLLTVNVQDVSGEYQYPLQVDPEYVTGKDRSLTGGVFPVEHPKEGETNWVSIFSSAFSVEHSYKKQYGLGGNPEWYEQAWYIEPNNAYNAGEFAGLRYRTKGESTIYNLEMDVEGENEPSQTATAVEYRYNEKKGEGEEEGQDNHVTLSEGIHQTRYEDKPLSMTSGYLHNPLETPRENDVRLMDYTTQHEALYGFWTWIYDAQVYVAQEESKHPEVESTSACPQCGFNKSSATIAAAGGRANVLHGSGTWLSPYQGAFEATAHDPGIGVSFAGFTGTIGYHPHWIRKEEGKCLGIQCPETYSDWMTYNSSMPNGDDETEFFAEDAAGLIDDTYAYPRIKVDASKPYNLGFTGMPEEGAEISAALHKLTVHATDGKKPTPSSGIRSVSVSIDGNTPTELSGASCPEGECTASGEYALDAENLSEGVHRLVVSAVSNSGEAEATDFLFDVRHASPVSVGPGSVDPTTGQLALTASDVSLGGASGVSRSYQSRSLTSGASGPLGPQWAMSVGAGEDLTVLPTGSVSVVSGNGGRTTFSLNKKGEYQSPKGDENLKVEYKSSEHKYVLKDEKAGTETVFEQPKGTEDTSPQDANQFGSESSLLDRPVSDAIDSSGDIWVTDWMNNRIVKFSPTGELLATYGTYGFEAGEMIKPWGIAINQKTGNVYVTDYGNNRIDEFSSSGSFIKAMGWGVSNGGAEYETCTSTCIAGIAGSGNGQFNALEGVSVDSSGNIWAVDYGNERVEEFNEAGEYQLKFGSAGSGAGQFNAPMDIAFAGGSMYITDESNNRVDEFSTTGTFIKTVGWGVSNGKEELETCTSSCQAGIAGPGNGQFNLPRGLTTDPASGNLYVTEIGGDRVQEITTSGAFVTKFGSGGSGLGQFAQPMGVVVSSSEEIYVTDFENARVQESGRQTWWPTSAKGSLSKSTTYLYQSVTGSEGTSIEPSEVLSPTPEGVSCGTKTEELKEEKDKGCHALTYKYATETKAESGSEWGEFKGHLSQVIFHAWNPSAKAMEEKAVAQYSYDKQGRLRAEWDPRIASSTACGKTCSVLKTIYGYDAEGHVTALTPPGQESWAFTYGTIAGDGGVGRLVKVTRAPASAGLWNGKTTEITTSVPEFSGSALVGVRMTVSSGTWSNSPVAYGYQWEDCIWNDIEDCTVIPGATNASYTPTVSDAGYRLNVLVTATNGGGSSTRTPNFPSEIVEWARITSYSTPGHEKPIALTAGPGKDLWYIERNHISKMSTSGEATEYTLPIEEEPSAITPGPDGNLWFTEFGQSKIGKMTPTGESTVYKLRSLNLDPGAITTGSDGDLWFVGYNKISKSTTGGEVTEYSLPSGSEPAGIAAGSDKNLWFTEERSSKIGKITTSGTITEYALPSGSEPRGIAAGPDENLWFTDHGTSKIGKITTSGTITEYELSSGSGPSSITSGPDSSLWFTDIGTGKIGKISTSGTITEYSRLSKYGLGDIVASEGYLWFNEQESEKISKLNPSTTEGEAKSPGPGTTIEYHVPLSGSESSDLPNLTKERVEEWGQKDVSEYEDNDPVEGMAVFPPDEPQGWPASDYKRATIDYMNAKGLTVNIATPSGGISTTEYNALNETVRTLSADDRAAAMKEGCKSVSKKECKSSEVSPKLDSKTEYSPEGGEIEKKLGPEHTVKLSTGEEVKARAVTHYYYDEGAEEAEAKNRESYNLVTKTISGALLSSGKEEDKRETITSYGGQEYLGWKLRKPTSVTTDPGGLDLTSSTTYNPSTGDVVEAQTPGANKEAASELKSFSSFGGSGSGAGQLSSPAGVATDSSGDVWVADTGHDRVQEFNSKGEFVRQFGAAGKENGEFKEPKGIAVDSKGDVWVADTGNERVQEFSSKGEFVRAVKTCEKYCSPEDVAVDGEGHVWTIEVTFSSGPRVQEFSAEGVLITKFGSEGKENGKFKEPRGIAVDSKGNVWVADTGNDRVQEFKSTGEFVRVFGSEGTGNGQFKSPIDLVFDSEGDLWVADSGNSRVQRFTSEGSYLSQVGTIGNENGQFNKPEGIAIDSSGNVWVADTGNNRIETWTPEHRFVDDAKTIYYTPGTESRVTACQSHPEWANLPCQTEPAAQPKHAPELPVTRVASYNIWDEAEKTEEKFGTGSKEVIRTKTETYDPAGRAVTSEETASPATDTALPKSTDEYNAETGAVEKQSTSGGTITSKDNTLGQQIEYKDASGNVAKYVYEEGGDGRLEEVSEGKGEEAKSTETYSYNGTTGFMEKLVDTAAGMSLAQGTFTASYDVEGKMTSETYPNAMTATTTYNSVGQATGVVYEKTADCASKCPEVWFSDSVVPSIHGTTLSQTSTLAKEGYAYDCDDVPAAMWA